MSGFSMRKKPLPTDHLSKKILDPVEEEKPKPILEISQGARNLGMFMKEELKEEHIKEHSWT